jgi:hypothetical protein
MLIFSVSGLARIIDLSIAMPGSSERAIRPA